MSDFERTGLGGRLRWSMLTALGLLPFACSGRVEHEPDGARAAAGSDKGSGTAGTGQVGSAGRVSGSGGTSGGGGTANTRAGAAGAAGESSEARPTCTDPELDPKSGLVSCAEGFRHRPQAMACPLSGAPVGDAGLGGAGGAWAGAGGDAGLPRTDGEVSCFHDPEACDAFELGYCDEDTGGGGNPAVCKSGCIADNDCGDGFICICAGPSPTGGVCQRSDCKTSDDCEDGYLCASVETECGGEVFSCQKPQDECWKDADCSEGSCVGDYGGGFRRCSDDVCAIGRPFLVAEELRVPPVAARADWRLELTPCLEYLTFAERIAQAERWTRAGQMEHASIAAFARFSLQLLSLGAPPELVEQCTQALADETAHAKLCFGLASAYAGRAIGPGPLDVSGALETTSLLDIVDLVIVEGCFGETSAALEALEDAATATDPVIVAACTQIARDEQRHAELAFRFVRWALEHGGAAVGERIEAALQSDLARSHAARSVAEPCLSALLMLSLAA